MKRDVRLTGVLALASLFALTAAPALAQDGGSLDAELQQELDNDLLQGLDDLPPPPAAPAEAFPPDPTRPPVPDEGPAPVGEDVGAPESAADGPLAEIGRQMRQVERSLAERDTSVAIQRRQEEIVQRLAEAIAALEQQQQSSPSGGQPSPAAPNPGGEQGAQPQPGPGEGSPDGPESERPAEDSQEREGEAPPDSAAAAGESLRGVLERVWGQLPERTRQAVQAAGVEQFLPGYESQLEEYFQKLAEEPLDGP